MRAPVCSLRHNMRAVLCENLGDPSEPFGSGVLKYVVDWPKPAILKGHVRIKVSASSINFPDALQIKGEYQVKPNLPFVPGSEVSGFVLEVGEGVKGLAVGDRVCAVRSGGAYAEEVVVPSVSVWKLPAAVDLDSAAVIPVVYGTAELALHQRAKLSTGQTLLVLGAGGGVGLAAVQIGKVLGATVIAVDLGEEKMRFLKQQGADVTIDASTATKEKPLSALIKAHAPKGVNVVFDPVGAHVLKEALKCVAWAAQYLIIGFAAGGIPQIPANILLVKNTTVHGIFWGNYLQFNPALVRAGMMRVLDWVAQGKIQLSISHRFPLEQLPDGFRMLLERKVLGKLLITLTAPSKM